MRERERERKRERALQRRSTPVGEHGEVAQLGCQAVLGAQVGRHVQRACHQRENRVTEELSEMIRKGAGCSRLWWTH